MHCCSRWPAAYLSPSFEYAEKLAIIEIVWTIIRIGSSLYSTHQSAVTIDKRKTKAVRINSNLRNSIIS
jgi:hypothetical protein